MRRRSRRNATSVLATLAGLVVIVAFVLATDLLEDGGAGPAPADPHPMRLALPEGTTIESLQRAAVVSVIDGDTIDVTLAGKTQRIRFFGVDTPERNERCYKEATARNRELVAAGVLLLPDARDIDRNGRILRYIFLPDGTSVDATLVAEGYGRAWREDGRYRDQIVAIEHEADLNNRGCLWGSGS